MTVTDRTRDQRSRICLCDLGWVVFKVENSQFSKGKQLAHFHWGIVCTFSKGRPARLQRENARLFNGKADRTLVAPIILYAVPPVPSDDRSPPA